MKKKSHLYSFFKDDDDYFLMWTIFKVFIEFVTTSPPFYVLAFRPRGMWDPSSLTRDRTCSPGTAPALEGEVPTTGRPGESLIYILKAQRS